MTVIGAGDVEAAHRRGVPLVIGTGDLVTPLAAERARDLGVAVRRGETPVATRPESAAPLPTRRPADPGALNALYRRGAPVAAALEPGTGQRGAKRPRIAVIGAGHVGSVTTLRLAESDVFSEVVLVDVLDGLAAGIALDLWHSASLARFGTTITGTDDPAAIAGADYIVLTAGLARKPGMSRTDLTEANAAVVGPIADRIAVLAPGSVVIVVTNPLEEMTHLVGLRTGFPSGRVLGMAGVLDSARFAALVALTGVCRPDRLRAFALGSHGAEMVIPLSQASVDGTPLRSLLDDRVLSEIVIRTRDSGAEVVSLLKTGSAYFAPGQSAARMAVAMVTGSDEILACAVQPDGQYGLYGGRVGLPVRLGPGGLREIVQLPLEPAELQALRYAADRLGERTREVAADASGDLLRAR